jgi:hypothetical protein
VRPLHEPGNRAAIPALEAGRSVVGDPLLLVWFRAVDSDGQHCHRSHSTGACQQLPARDAHPATIIGHRHIRQIRTLAAACLVKLLRVVASQCSRQRCRAVRIRRALQPVRLSGLGPGTRPARMLTGPGSTTAHLPRGAAVQSVRR